MTDPIKKQIGGGLNRTPEDARDFKYGAFFRLPAISELPRNYRVENSFGFKDQQDTDFCTGYAGTYASEIQEEEELSPEYQFAKTKQVAGEYESWGADLRQMLKSLTLFGSLPKLFVPKDLRYDGTNRNIIANWENWPKHLDETAYAYRKQSYFKVTGQYDLFDDIRATLWNERAEKRIAITGALWRYEWTVAPGGYIPKEELSTNDAFGHAFVFEGWEEREEDIWLIGHLSNGTDIGDSGHFYFSREVVNRECGFAGVYTIKDIPPEVVKQAQKIGIENWYWILRWWFALRKMIQLKT